MLSKTAFAELYALMSLRYPREFPQNPTPEVEKATMAMWYEDLCDLNDQVLREAFKLVRREEVFLNVKDLRRHAQRVWDEVRHDIEHRFYEPDNRALACVRTAALSALGPAPVPALLRDGAPVRDLPPLEAFLPPMPALVQSTVDWLEEDGDLVDAETRAALQAIENSELLALTP